MYEEVGEEEEDEEEEELKQEIASDTIPLIPVCRFLSLHLMVSRVSGRLSIVLSNWRHRQ